MIEYLILLLAIPFGIIAANVTRFEKNIYSKSPYFPFFIWVLAILTAVFLTLDKTAGLSFAFMLILAVTWLKF